MLSFSGSQLLFLTPPYHPPSRPYYMCQLFLCFRVRASCLLPTPSAPQGGLPSVPCTLALCSPSTVIASGCFRWSLKCKFVPYLVRLQTYLFLRVRRCFTGWLRKCVASNGWQIQSFGGLGNPDLVRLSKSNPLKVRQIPSFEGLANRRFGKSKPLKVRQIQSFDGLANRKLRKA